MPLWAFVCAVPFWKPPLPLPSAFFSLCEDNTKRLTPFGLSALTHVIPSSSPLRPWLGDSRHTQLVVRMVLEKGTDWCCGTQVWETRAFLCRAASVRHCRNHQRHSCLACSPGTSSLRDLNSERWDPWLWGRSESQDYPKQSTAGVYNSHKLMFLVPVKVKQEAQGENKTGLSMGSSEVCCLYNVDLISSVKSWAITTSDWPRCLITYGNGSQIPWRKSVYVYQFIVKNTGNIWLRRSIRWDLEGPQKQKPCLHKVKGYRHLSLSTLMCHWLEGRPSTSLGDISVGFVTWAWIIKSLISSEWTQSPGPLPSLKLGLDWNSTFPSKA